MKNFNTHDSFLQRFRTFWLIALMVIVTGCSSVKLAYNNGDTLLYWWLNAYLDLDSDQASEVKKDIDDLFNWHRKTQLKTYVQLLETAKRQLAGNLTQADLLADYKEAKTRTELLAQRALPELTELAMTIKPDQLEQMEKKFKKNNETYRKKFMTGSVEERQKQRYKKSMEQLELWFGNFSRDQEAQLRKASDARPLDNQIWLDERIRRQQKILAALRKVHAEKLNKEATGALMQGLVRDIFERMESPERKAFFDTYIDSTTQFILTATRIATPEQKAHAQKRMQGWIEDFNTLAAAQK